MNRLNINDNVKVILTDIGLAILEKEHKALMAQYPAVFNKPFENPGVDSEGYTAFPLWVLMQTFGPYMDMALPLPFKATIYVK